MFLLFQCGIFRFYVRFQGCSSWLQPPTKKSCCHMWQALQQWAKKGSKSKLILAETSSLWKMLCFQGSLSNRRVFDSFGTKKNLSKDRWRSPLPWMSWLNIMVPKTKKTLYLGVAIAIDPDSPRRIKSKNTFKRHGFFFTKNLHSQGRSHVFSNGGVVFLSVKITMWGTFVSVKPFDRMHRWGLLKPWNN